MPGHDPPVMQKREELEIRDGKKGAVFNAARDLSEKRGRIFNVFKDLEANRAIPLRVVAGQAVRLRLDPAIGQTPPLQDFAAVRIRFQAKPVMAGGSQS